MNEQDGYVALNTPEAEASVLTAADVPFVDLRVYTEEGTLDLVASKEKHDQSFVRRMIRRLAKRGRMHNCEHWYLHISHRPEHFANRQQRRAWERRIVKQALREKKTECHPARRVSPNGGRMRRLMRGASKDAA